MSEQVDKTPYVILGCGYTGTRLSQALRQDGIAVRACARRVALLEPLAQLGVDVHYLDASRARSFGPVLRSLPGAVVVYSIPGVPALPVGEAVRRAADAALQARAKAFIYLSTTGVYGRNEGFDLDAWVDEDAAVDIHDPDMTSRLADEAATSAAAQAGLRTVVLRLSAIYGPPLWPGGNGRGVRARLRRGEYRLWDGGKYYFSRIHVDDLVQVIRAAAERAPAGSLYVVGDDHPCPQGEYGRWLAAHLGLPEPPSQDALQPGQPRQMIRGRRIRNQKMKDQLGVVLRYPTYREGEAQIDEAEGRTAPAPAQAPEPVPAQTKAPEAAQAPAEWPWRHLLPGALPEEVLPGGRSGRVEVEALPAGGRSEAGAARLVLSGAPRAAWRGRSYALGAHALVPQDAILENEGPEPCFLLRFSAI
jgi:nucleoside-diphosphate-sugar epimerase